MSESSELATLRAEVARLRAEVERLARERDEATRAFHSLWSVSGDCLKAAKEPDRNPWIGEEPWKRHVREMAEIEKGALGIALARAETAEARVAALEAELSHLRRLIRSSPLGHFGGSRGYTTQIPESAVDRIDALLAPAEPRNREADTATAKAALDSYLAGRTDSHGFPVEPTPAEPCATCGGSGIKGERLHRDPRTECLACNPVPCDDCRKDGAR